MGQAMNLLNWRGASGTSAHFNQQHVMIINFLKRWTFFALPVICMVLAVNGLSRPLMAQSSSQVTIVGIPPILPTPFANDLENSFVTGQYQIIFNYTSFTQQPVDFVFDFQVFQNNRRLISVQSLPSSFTPGTYVFTSFFEELVFTQGADEVFRQLDDAIRNQIIQTGTLPEGEYSIVIEARPATAQANIAALAGTSNFSVRYPQPPIPVSPPNGANVTLGTPVFSWTPVVNTAGIQMSYEFLLVEVVPGQSPLQAINSNREHAFETLAGNTTLPYTLQYLPLEPGAEYAWQITASDVMGNVPLQNDGKMEIQTFTYLSDEPDEDLIADISLVDEITLIPGFATLSGIGNLSATETSDSYVLNGDATLELEFTGSSFLEAGVQVSDLTIQKQSLSNPVLMGGSLNGPAGQLANLLPDENSWIEFEELTWSFGQNITTQVSINLPGVDSADAVAELTVTPNGLSGTAEISGEPLVQYSDEYLTLEMYSLGISFPENQTFATGDVLLNGIETPCNISGYSMNEAALSADVLCSELFTIPLVDGTDRLMLEVDRVLGDVTLGQTAGSFSYDLELRSGIGLKTENDRYCGSSAVIGLSSDEGLNVVSSQSNCPGINPRVDLGFASLQIEDSELNTLSYNPATGAWDFGLTMDAFIEVEAFDNWVSAVISDITIDREGITFSETDLETQFGTLPTFDAELFEISLDLFRLDSFTFPLFDWDETGPGTWDLLFEGNAVVQNGFGAPQCLLGTSLELTNGRVDENSVVGDLALADFEGCVWEPGAGITISIDAISGSAGVNYPELTGIEPFGNLNLAGAVTVGQPFTCDGMEPIAFEDEQFVISDGLEGTLENVVPGCPLQIGPFEGQVTDSDIAFSYSEEDGQQAVMNTEATIILPEGIEVDGTASINLISGAITEASFIIDEPFDWHVPTEENPVLSFRIEYAEITGDGFYVDGRHQLILPESNMGVTFEDFLFDLETVTVEDGRIIFDDAFAFEAGIAEDLSGFEFSTVPMGSELSLENGILMELAGNIIIDTQGLRASGTANASVSYNGVDYDSAVTVEYSDNFRMSLTPFGVASGRADFYYEGDHFAYADPSGFHPVPAFFADLLIPERLPLPTEEIAYIQLREEDELLVSVTENEEGNFVITSLPGQPLTLVVPYLNPSNPPELADITLNDLTIAPNPFNPEIISGSVSAAIPEGDPRFDLSHLNIPLVPRAIEYGSRIVNDVETTALYFLGDLMLFDQQLADEAEVAFYLRGDGYVRADLNLSGMNTELSLTPDGEVTIGVTALRGFFEMMMGSGASDYDFFVDGNLRIETEQGQQAGADLTIRTQPGGYSEITEFDAYAFGDLPAIDLGEFRIGLEEMLSVENFSYTTSSGFEFAILLDVVLHINLADNQELDFPVREIEIRNDGFFIPTQNISEASIPGLNLPDVELGGFSFTPLALRTPDLSWLWPEAPEIGNSLSMDFSLMLPEFEGTGLNPPDGLLFTSVGLDEGYLVGEVEPIGFLSPVEIPVIPGSGADTPTLLVEAISGALRKADMEGGFRQAVDVDISGSVGQLPAFTVNDPNLCSDAEFSLSIIDGRAFEGSVDNMQPCGMLELGPVTLEMTSASLNFYLDENEQKAELDGSAQITLPVSEGSEPPVVSGDLTLDLITGQISDGSIAINQPFELGLPMVEMENPLFSLGVNQAELSAEGLKLSGQGSLSHDPVNVEVTYEELIFELPAFEIVGGSATIASDVAVDFTVSPFALSLAATGSPLPDEDVLRMNLDAAITLDQNGLTFNGSSNAELRFNEQMYSNLRVELVDDFAMSLNGLAVTRGRAEFYWDQDGQPPAEEYLAMIDEDGIHLGVGLVALVPERLPLPTEDIAYIQLRDENGDPYIEAETTDSGYTFSTNGEFLPIVFAAFSSPGDTLTAGVSFTLFTDDAFNVTGGDLELEDEINLAEMLNLPVSVTNLALSSENGLSLEAGLRFDLPSIFENIDEDAEAEVFAVLNADGIESGEFFVEADPIVSVGISGSGDLSGDAFSASLTRIEASFGSQNSVAFEGTLSSSLVMGDDDEPLAFQSAWGDNAWNFAIEAYQHDGLTLGSTTFQFDDENPISLYADDESFYVSVNGQVSFENLLAEPVLVTVQDLVVGADNLQSNPSLLFDIGEITGELGDQQFGLFDNAVVFSLIDPAIGLDGRNLTITSDGNIGFLEQQIGYQDLMISTSGDISIGDVSVSAVNIFEDYLVMQSFGLNFENGIRVESELELTLPAPADEYTATGTLAIFRDESGEITVDQGGLQFDLENERFELLEFGEFALTKVGVQIDPFEWENAGLFANGQIYLNTQPNPVLEFGEAANFPNNAGIGISYDGNQVQLQYNITGNPAFEYELSFFTIAVSADITGSSQNGFQITLDGQAGMNLESVEAELAYGGIIITEEGLVDYGNIQGGSISVAGVASLTVGQFIYQKDENGFSINLADTEEKGPEELQQNGDFSSGEVATNSVEVVELLCFGPCPEIGQDSDFEALSLSISADTGSESGGIQGGVDRVMFYRTSDGISSLTIENAFIEIDNIFEMSASINYVQASEGVLLRAAATGNFGGTIGALVAGKFSNTGGEVSFGLFVAVETSAGIPIVPGIVTLTGAGGGFFYKPIQDDLDMVHNALGNFGHELVDPEAAQIQGQADFAVMLYASVGIAGTAGQYVVEGSTFFQITSQSFYMDARVHVLGMDGENSVAQTEVEGTLSASIQRNPFAMSIGIDVGITVPFVLEGGGGIQYFMNEQDSGIVWGIIGYADFELFGGVMNGGGNFLAGNPGVMLEVYLGFDLDIAIIQVQSQLTGSVWMITDPSYSYPFGAYIIFDVEASLMGLASVSASAQAAFLTRNPSGYIFFASVHGCVGTPLGDACGSAWASYSSQDGLDFGLGHHANANLIAEAQAQMEQFEEHIYALMSGIPGALESLETTLEPNFEIQTAEDARMAGQNFYGLSQYQRSLWDDEIHDPQTVQSLPQALQNVRQNVMLSPDPQFASTSASQHQAMAQTAIDILTGLESEISADMLTAQELSEYAQQQYDSLIESMSQSPVGNVQKPAPSLSATESVDFEIDDQLAGQQIANSQEYRNEMEQMDAAIRSDIQSVMQSLEEMSMLLQSDNPSGEDNNLINLAHWYGRVHMEMEKYFAFEADRFNKEVNWAMNLLGYINSNQSAIQNASEAISNQHSSLASAAFATRQNVTSPEGDVNDFALRFTNRNHFIYKLKQENPGFPFLAQPGLGYDLPAEIQEIYDNLSTPIYAFNNADRENIRQSNLNFWWEMNYGGLTEYRESRLDYLLNGEMTSTHDEYRTQIMAPLREMTGILDDFYTIKANTTAILYNMIDEYVHWKPEEDVQGERAALFMHGKQFGGYEQLRDFLADQLLPPQITDIQMVSENSDNFYNQTGLIWNATHRDRVVETAINMEYGSSGTGSSGFISVGNRNDFTLYPYSRDNDTIEEVDISVRVRGSGGNTAVRRASFSVDVAPDVSPAMITSSGSVVPAQTNPPQRPEIDLRELYTSAESEYGFAYWTNSSDNIMLKIEGNDPEVGIGKWEYTIGTSPGESDVIEWSTLQGQIQHSENISAQTITGPARSFVLEPGVPYYLSARVENTLGQVSPVQVSQVPLIYDNTVPSYITYDRSTTPVEQPSSAVRRIYGPITELQPYSGSTETRLSWSEKSDQRLLFRNIEVFVADPYSEEGRSAEAPQNYSGVSRFEYVLSGSEDMALQQFEQLAGVFHGSELIVENPDFEVEEDIYWHVRAVDNAGNTGELNTFGPFQLEDYTLPEPGELRAISEPNGVKLFVIDPPFDPESDLLGVQYAIATGRNMDNIVRPFPGGSQVDLDWDYELSLDLWNSSFLFYNRYADIPEEVLRETGGEDFYILYRSVNTLGMTSDIYATGPIVIDDSPPLSATIDVSFNYNWQQGSQVPRYRIFVDDIHDPESGILKVEYWIERRSNPNDSWGDISSLAGFEHFVLAEYDQPRMNAFTLNPVYSPSLNFSYPDMEYRVKVRITNGSGLTRVQTAYP